MKYAVAFAAVLALGMTSAVADGLIENDPSLRASSFPAATTTQPAPRISNWNHNGTLRAYASVRNSAAGSSSHMSNSVALPFDPAYGRSGGDNR